jgi:hypothetical protein
MLDVTRSLSIAKAFAAGSTADEELEPTLYQLVLWNVDFFDTGTMLLHSLSGLARPRAQSALAQFGFTKTPDGLYDRQVLSSA